MLTTRKYKKVDVLVLLCLHLTPPCNWRDCYYQGQKPVCCIDF